MDDVSEQTFSVSYDNALTWVVTLGSDEVDSSYWTTYSSTLTMAIRGEISYDEASEFTPTVVLDGLLDLALDSEEGAEEGEETRGSAGVEINLATTGNVNDATAMVIEDGEGDDDAGDESLFEVLQAIGRVTDEELIEWANDAEAQSGTI